MLPMSSTKSPAIADAWPPPPQSSRERRDARRAGMRLGLTVAAVIVAIGVPLFVAGGAGVPLVIAGLAGPTLLVGATTGFMLGPMARRAQTASDRVGVALVMAIYATAIGDLAVGFVIGLAGAPWGSFGLAGALIQAAMSALVLWPLGLLFFGIVAVPATFVAGLVWVFGMARLARPPRRV
jgi:hypothetical protein